MNGKLESSKEEVNLSAHMDRFHHDGPVLPTNADAPYFSG